MAREHNNRVGEELHGIAEKEEQAVENAIKETENMETGQDRMKVVKLVLFDQTHRIPGAALAVPCSERTAAQWHGDFIRLVAKNFGLLD